MTWDKPKKLRQWLVLLIPAGICVLATALGVLVQPKDGDWTAWAVVGLLIAIVISFGQSIWLARVNQSLAGKIVCALICFAILLAIDGTVSFAGCTIGWSTVSPLRID
jgi:hypothetical protein